MAINPLLAMTQGGPAQMGAAPAAAPAASPWGELGGYVNNLVADPARMATLMTGLGLLSGNDLAQSAGTGFGIYNQIAQGQAASAAAKREAAIENARLGLETREVDQGDEKLEIEREKIRSNERVAKIRANAAKAPKAGVDSKIWKQAYDTVAGNTPLDQEININKVYETYNTMSGAEPVYPTFGRQELQAHLTMLGNYPESADEIIGLAERNWGPKAGQALRARWEKTQTTSTGSGQETGDDETSSTDSRLPPPGVKTQAPVPAGPTSTFSRSPLLWLNQ